MKNRTSWMFMVLAAGLMLSLCVASVEGRGRKKFEKAKVPQKRSSEEDYRTRAEEAELVVSSLLSENDQLKKELDRTSEEMRKLNVTLAEVTAELDVMKAQRDQAWIEKTDPVGEGVVQRVEWSVLDVNEELNMVVLDGGTADGILVGMKFMVLKDNKAMAEIRVMDARTKISGAVVEKNFAGMFPEKGWRAIVGRAERN